MADPSTAYVLTELVENISLGGGSFVLRFAGCDFLAGARAGQFVMLRSEDWGTDPLLPRAFSLLSVDPDGRADILIKAAGKASRMLEHALPGARFSLLGPLGNGFADPHGEREHWLVAGGVGLAPLYMVARRASELGCADAVTMFYGGRGSADLVMLEDIADTGVECVLATEDGSRGTKGYVTTAVENALASRSGDAPRPTLLACGPDPMLEAVARLARREQLDCDLSLEGEMACGIGACLVCAVPCHGERPYQYACLQGPVFSLDTLAGRYEVTP